MNHLAHHVWEVPGLTGDVAAHLMAGVPEGRRRPQLFLMTRGGTLTLASFHGDGEYRAFVTILDSMFEQINRTIEHHLPKPSQDQTEHRDDDGTGQK